MKIDTIKPIKISEIEKKEEAGETHSEWLCY